MSYEFETAPPFLIDRNAHLLRQLLKQLLAEAGIDLATEEFAVLYALHSGDGQRIGELASVLVRDTTTVTRQIESLERKKCVKRKPARDDRRAVETFLTARGREWIEKFMPVVSEVRERLLDDVSESDRETFVRCLLAVRNNLYMLSKQAPAAAKR